MNSRSEGDTFSGAHLSRKRKLPVLFATHSLLGLDRTHRFTPTERRLLTHQSSREMMNRWAGRRLADDVWETPPLLALAQERLPALHAAASAEAWSSRQP
jgi:hypothetical protein